MESMDGSEASSDQAGHSIQALTKSAFIFWRDSDRTSNYDEARIVRDLSLEMWICHITEAPAVLSRGDERHAPRMFAAICGPF